MIKIAKFAEGILDKNIMKEPPNISSPQVWEYALGHHEAHKAGIHKDLRLMDSSGAVHSWRLDKEGLPDIGSKRLAIQQPTHDASSLEFEGTIPEGEYGAGTVEIADRDKVEVTRSSPTQVSFNIYRPGNPQEFALIKLKDNQWIIQNKTPHRGSVHFKKIPQDKPKYKQEKFENVKHSPTQAMTAKIDGAHAILHLKSGKIPRLFSYREPKKGKTGLIEHTHKIPELLIHRLPKKYPTTTLRVEITGTDKKTGKALPPETIGGMLNTNVWSSREKQKEIGHLHIVPIDVVRQGRSKLENSSYKKKLTVMQAVAQEIPKTKMPPIAFTEEEKKELLQKIQQEELPETKEGVVLHDLEGKDYTKIVIRPDYDVFVRGVSPGKGKYSQFAGGFYYSMEPEGKIVGKIGTGFSDSFRKALKENEKEYIGQKAIVHAQGITRKGALKGSASFKRIHLDTNNPEMKKFANSKGIYRILAYIKGGNNALCKQ